jgi:tRNA(His) guanylyltransferase
MRAFPEICIAYGESDEISFVLRKQSTLYGRRAYKIISSITSTFTASYIANWPSFLPTTPLSLDSLPTFDGRAVCYPTEAILRDYLSWRQVDTHINNLYNTAFWALVQQGEKSTSEAHSLLKNTSSAEKNELLFSQFGINYNNVPDQYRKGSVIVRIKQLEADGGGQNSKSRLRIKVLHVDIIQDEFWNLHPEILCVD